MKKRIFAILLTVVMVMALVPTAVFGIDIDKTADGLDENNQTTVTLSVGGTQDVENVAVLFVLDYSTSVAVRNAAAAFLKELAEKENTNIKAAVIDYSAVAAATKWTSIANNATEEELQALLASKTFSGTNYHAGLLEAQKMLESDEIEGYTTYLITISDGITYLWTDEDTGKTMTVPYQMIGHNGDVSTAHDGTSVWDMTYGEGTPLVNVTDDEGSTTEGAYNDFNEFFDEITTKIKNTEKYFAVYGSAYSNAVQVYNSDYGTTYKELTAEVVAEYATNVEVAVYNTISTYKELVEEVDYAYAFKMDENHWGTYPWGEQLMDYLISESDNSGDIASGEISDTAAEDVFSTIRDQILYEIMSGTVTDYIGEDFDWIGMNTVTLTVGEDKLEGTVNDNTVTFGTAKDDVYPYVVTYYPDGTDDEGNAVAEYLTWEINVPVEAARGLTLTYQLKVSEDYEMPEGQTHDVLPTNESAEIEYTDPEGEENTETFPVPEVDLGEKTDLPSLDKTIVLTDDEGVKTYVDQDDVAAGDTVTFQLKSNVPSNLDEYINYSSTSTSTSEDVTVNLPSPIKKDKDGNNLTYVLTFHDVLNSELSFNDDVTVKVGSTTLTNTNDATYYTVTTSATDDCTFEVSMDLLDLYTNGIITESDFGSAVILITYTADLNEEAAAGTYKNTAWVTYPDGTSVKDVVEVDTYGIEVFKYDQATATTDEDGNITATGLAGAVFTVYSDAECTDVITTITTGTDGYATLEGLDAGTYYLVETEAPAGYVCSEGKITVTIEGGGGKETNIYSVTVANAAIPETGGAGTVIFTVVGGGLIVAAAAVLLVSRRKHRDEE